MPCSKLAGKNGQRLLAKRVSRTGYTGFYTRVLGKGMIKMGDAFERVERNPDRISEDDVNDVIYERSQNFTLIERLTGMPELAARGRAVFAERLERAGGRRQWV
jgi:MOSC domain-containing protein YiiM